MTRPSVRSLIHAIQGEVLKSEELAPERAAELLAQLAALLGNCNDEIRRAEMAYNKVLMIAYDTELKANRAKIKAENTKQYEEKLEARHTRELALELIRSLKYFLKAKESEFQYAGHQ